MHDENVPQENGGNLQNGSGGSLPNGSVGNLRNGNGGNLPNGSGGDSRFSFGPIDGDGCDDIVDPNDPNGGAREVDLVELFQDLLSIASQIKEGVEVAIRQHQDAKAKRAEQEDVSESDEEDEEEELINEDVEEDPEEEPEEDDEEDQDEEDEDYDGDAKRKVKILYADINYGNLIRTRSML